MEPLTSIVKCSPVEHVLKYLDLEKQVQSYLTEKSPTGRRKTSLPMFNSFEIREGRIR